MSWKRRRAAIGSTACASAELASSSACVAGFCGQPRDSQHVSGDEPQIQHDFKVSGGRIR